MFAYDASSAGRGPMKVGLLLIVPMIAAFGVWAATAPLNSAAIAAGEIVLSSERKTIQHLEGGLVKELYVQEGTEVEQGAPLVVVEDLNERAQIEALTVQLVNTRAQIARLVAERDGADAPDFSAIAESLTIDPEKVDAFADTHLGVFENLTASASSVVSLAQSRKEQIAREADGLRAQLAAKRDELVFVEDELENQESLFERGLSIKEKVTEQKRRKTVLEGEIGSLTASIARVEQSLIDQDLEIVRMRNERSSALLGELQQAQVSTQAGLQELRTLQDRQARTVIRAPVDGNVLAVQVHTIGAVVAPGAPLMDIVPAQDDLIVEARVLPTDIDLVFEEMDAKVQLSAFKAQKVQKLSAKVTSVSGDILSDEMTGERYFLARLVVDEKELAELPETVSLSAGMPADVFLIAGERTVADYLLSPIVDAAYKAFRED